MPVLVAPDKQGKILVQRSDLGHVICNKL